MIAAPPFSAAELEAIRVFYNQHADDPAMLEMRRLIATFDLELRVWTTMREFLVDTYALNDRKLGELLDEFRAKESDACSVGAESPRASNSPNAGEVRGTSSGQGSGPGKADSVTGRRDGHPSDELTHGKAVR